MVVVGNSLQSSFFSLLPLESLANLSPSLILRSTKFSTLPETLIITPNRFPTINWVPKKIEIPLEISWKNLDLSEFLGKGLGVGEVELPDSDDSDSLSFSFILCQV